MVTRDPSLIRSPKRWGQHIRAKVRSDDDAVIVVTGDERVGKSTLAFRLAHVLDESFALERCVFKATDLITRATDAPRYSVVWLDEAIEGGMGREAMSRPNRELVKFFTVAGERNLVYLILWPNLAWLDKYLKNHRADWRIHIPERGLARFYYPVRGEFSSGTWWEEATFSPIEFPAVEGGRWDEYERHKSRFVEETGRRYAPGGRDDEEGEADPLADRRELLEMVERREAWVEPIVGEMLGWSPPGPSNGSYSTKERELYEGWDLEGEEGEA